MRYAPLCATRSSSPVDSVSVGVSLAVADRSTLTLALAVDVRDGGAMALPVMDGDVDLAGVADNALVVDREADGC